MAVTTKSTKIWASEDQDFKTLLEEYYKAMAAREAYERFFGLKTTEVEPKFTYEQWEDAIEKSTKKALDGDGINSRSQAKEAIDKANFAKNRNEFRKIGLMLGLDPEHFSKYEVRKSADGYFESLGVAGSAAENWRRDNLTYTTGVTRPTQTPSVARYLQVREDLDAARYSTDDPELTARTAERQGREVNAFYFVRDLSFSSPQMIAYMLKKSYGNDGYKHTPASDLANAVSAALKELVTKQQAANTSDQLDSAWAGSVQSVMDIDAAVQGVTARLLPPPDVFNWSDDSPMISKILYADTTQDATRAVVEAHIAKYLLGGSLRAMDDLITPLLEGDDRFTGQGWEMKVLAERDAILAFFKAAGKKDPDPLPDAPEFETFEELLEDKKSGAKYRKNVLTARRNLVPRDMQCYLLENIKKITEQRAPGGRFAPDYKHVKTVNTNGRPALLTTLIRNGMNGDDDVKQLLDLCPDVYALLTPTIRLFRTDYDEHGNIKKIEVKEGSNSKMVDAVAEIPIPNFLKKSDVASILLGTRGRMAGAGVKSFSWSLDGTQPAEVDNNITATLDVFFQSPDDFFNNMRQAGMVNSDGFPLPNFIDLIVNSPAIRKNTQAGTGKIPAKLLHREYKGANFRIKAIVGWEAPSQEALNAVRQLRNAQNLAEILRRSQATYYLQCVRHNLDFRQNGTVALQIQYQASVAGILSSPNADILAPSTQSVLESLGEIDEQIESTTGSSNQTEKRKQALLEEREKIINQDRLVKYKKLLAGLFSSPRSKVYQVPVNLDDLMRVPYSELTPVQRAARAKRKLKEAAEGDLLITTPQQLNLTLLEQTAKTLAAGGDGMQTATEFEKAEQRRYRELQQSSGDFKFVPFMFLGDLIDVAIEQVKINNNDTPMNFELFLAETDLIDPLVALRIKDFGDLKGTGLDDVGFLQKLRESDPLSFRDDAGVRFSINLGDIPISVDAFQVWFKNHVIKRDLDKFFLLYFIKKVCADLITKAFTTDCFGENLNINQRYDAHPLTLREEAPSPVSAHGLGQLAQLDSSALDSKVHNAVIILPTDSRPSALRGIEDDDFSQGIHHHHIGAACGLVKKISFSREDQEYLREANLQKEGALGPEQLRELYSVTLEMVGNTLYENGQYIYVSPTLMDADKKSLDYLGLHGYYMITSVASTVTPQGFTTTIKALHQGVDFSDNPALTPEFYDVAAEPGLPGQKDPNAHVRPGGVTVEEITKSRIEAAENKKAEDNAASGNANAAFEKLSKKNKKARQSGSGGGRYR